MGGSSSSSSSSIHQVCSSSMNRNSSSSSITAQMGSNMNRTIDATILHYCTTAPPDAPNGHRCIYVTDLGPNDVLLGRGKPSDRLAGNVQFRGIVNARLHEYAIQGHTKEKDALAKSIVAQIEKLGGRFLQVVARTTTTTERTTTKFSIASSSSSSSSSKASIGRIPTYTNTRLYQIVEYDVAVDKVKQTFRSMIHQYVKLKRRDYVDFDETDRQIHEYAKRKKRRDDDDDDTDRATIATMDPCTVDDAVLEDSNIPAQPSLQMADVPVHSNIITAKDRMAVAAGINSHPNVSAAGITVGNNNNTNNHLGIHTNSSYGLQLEQQLHLLSSLQVQQQLANDAINTWKQQYRLRQQQLQQCLDDIALLLQLHRRIHTSPSQPSISELLVDCVGTNGQTMPDALRIRRLEEALLAAVRQSVRINHTPPAIRSTSTAGIAGDTFPSNNGNVMGWNFQQLLATPKLTNETVWTNETLYHHHGGGGGGGGGEGSNVASVTVLHEIEVNQATRNVNERMHSEIDQ
jgi:hypothetical protein